VEGEEHGAEQASLTGLPCMHMNKVRNLGSRKLKRQKTKSVITKTVCHTNLIGNDPKTTPLQLRAKIALSACKSHKIQNNNHSYAQD
jgi:hypothetical protein